MKIVTRFHTSNDRTINDIRKLLPIWGIKHYFIEEMLHVPAYSYFVVVAYVPSNLILSDIKSALSHYSSRISLYRGTMSEILWSTINAHRCGDA